ncbi:MAG: hypothetical protein M1370_10715 [Bacteroidetes bacterium]|nr:hypothetical protein [Bacteroidota bacterium]MCL5026492.1 hypothetical protein [Chloroflexota bacterium]
MMRNRGSFGIYLTNLRSPMPWRRKLRLLARNNWIRLRTLSACCGHPREPGC